VDAFAADAAERGISTTIRLISDECVNLGDRPPVEERNGLHLCTPFTFSPIKDLVGEFVPLRNLAEVSGLLAELPAR
jgi:hypothetical protein